MHVVKYLLGKGARAEPYTFDGERVVYAALTDEIRRVLLKARTAEARVVSPLHTQLNKMLNQASEGATTADFKFLVFPKDAPLPSHGHRCDLPCLPRSQPRRVPGQQPNPGSATEVAVHKAVLAARSDFFAGRFAGEWAHVSQVGVPGGAQAAVILRAVVRWAYTDTVAISQSALQQLRALASHWQLLRMEAALALQATSDSGSEAPPPDTPEVAGGAVLHVDCDKVLNTQRSSQPSEGRGLLLDSRQRARLPSQLPFGSAGSSFKSTAAVLAVPPRIATSPRTFYAMQAPTSQRAGWGAAELRSVLPLAAFYFAAQLKREVAPPPANPAPPPTAAGTEASNRMSTVPQVRATGGAAAGDVFRLEAGHLSAMPAWQTAKGLHGRPGAKASGAGNVDILQLRTATSLQPRRTQSHVMSAPLDPGTPAAVLQRARARTLEVDMQRLLASVDNSELVHIPAGLDETLDSLQFLATTPLAADGGPIATTVHRSMFLARSPYWQAQFGPRFASGHEQVDLGGVRLSVARAVLRFVYCCAGVQAVDEEGVPLHEFNAGHLAAEVPPTMLTPEALVECAHLADLLLLPDLRALCAAAAVQCTSLGTAVEFYAMADAFTMRRLAAQCARVMAVHLDSCVLQAGWLQLARDSAASIKGRQATDSVPLIDDIMGELFFVETSVTRELESNCLQACREHMLEATGAQESDLHDIIAAVRSLPEHVLNQKLHDWSPCGAAMRRRRLAVSVLGLMGIAVVTHS